MAEYFLAAVAGHHTDNSTAAANSDRYRVQNCTVHAIQQHGVYRIKLQKTEISTSRRLLLWYGLDQVKELG